MVSLIYYAEDGTCLPAGRAVVGSDSPPDCHSLPTLQVPFQLKNKKDRYETCLSVYAEDGT